MSDAGWEYDEEVKYTQRIEDLKRQLTDAKTSLREARRMKYRFAEEPQSGTMLKVEKRWAPNGPSYTYLFFRKGVWWYSTTNRLASDPITWNDVRNFIGDNRCWILTVREEVPPKGA